MPGFQLATFVSSNPYCMKVMAANEQNCVKMHADSICYSYSVHIYVAT